MCDHCQLAHQFFPFQEIDLFTTFSRRLSPIYTPLLILLSCYVFSLDDFLDHDYACTTPYTICKCNSHQFSSVLHKLSSHYYGLLQYVVIEKTYERTLLDKYRIYSLLMLILKHYIEFKLLMAEKFLK